LIGDMISFTEVALGRSFEIEDFSGLLWPIVFWPTRAKCSEVGMSIASMLAPRRDARGFLRPFSMILTHGLILPESARKPPAQPAADSF
jgi:hypothetical protein